MLKNRQKKLKIVGRYQTWVKNGSDRIDEPNTHLAIRELFLNCLAHSDYYGRRGVVVVNTMSSISLGNPGDMRVALAHLSQSVPRGEDIGNIVGFWIKHDPIEILFAAADKFR